MPSPRRCWNPSTAPASGCTAAASRCRPRRRRRHASIPRRRSRAASARCRERARRPTAGRSTPHSRSASEALRADPLDAEAHLLLAAVEEERGDLEAAVAALRRAIYIAPNSPTAHFRLGALLLRTGDDGPGRRSLEAAAGLLGAAAPDAVVPGGDGVTAGRLLAAARAQLEPAP